MSRTTRARITKPLPPPRQVPQLPRVAQRQAAIELSAMGRAIKHNSPAVSPRQGDTFAGVAMRQAMAGEGSNVNQLRGMSTLPGNYGNSLRAALRGTSIGAEGSPF